MAWSQLENVLSSRVLPIIPGRSHHRLLHSSGKPHTQFAEKLLGLWDQRNCSIYENYLQILGVRTGNTVEMALESKRLGVRLVRTPQGQIRDVLLIKSQTPGLHERE